METFIQRNALDLVTLGQVQYDFTVNGVAGLDLCAACVQSTFKNVASVEAEMSAVAAAVRKRTARLHLYGSVLADLNAACGFIMQGKKGMTENDDLKEKGSKEILKRVKDVFKKNDLWNEIPGYYKDGTTTPVIKDDGVVMIGDLRKLRENTKFTMDKEDNALQRNASTLQFVMNKRDSALSVVGKLQKRIARTETSTIKNIGR